MNKINKELIQSVIVNEEYIFQGTFTVCVLELKNGFKVSGTSGCADPSNYDIDTGKDLARKAAESKIWDLEGYLLKQKLFEIGE